LPPGDESDQSLAERLITAEQNERRRLALFLHDGPIQSLSGIALMLDAAVKAVDDGRLDEARHVLDSALARHRETIRSLRDLSFNLEPVVLRDQGFAPAVRALADQLGLAHSIQIDLDVDRGESLADAARAALYQIIREALNQAVRRGPPTLVSVRIEERADGGVNAIVADDGSGERRRASVEAIRDRALPLNGRVRIEHPKSGGTVVRVALPPYRARD
jgi:two-component system, NarL family, sensor histidine kinase DegS